MLCDSFMVALCIYRACMQDLPHQLASGVLKDCNEAAAL